MMGNRTATAILAGACVAVLAGMLLVVRRARLSGIPPGTAEATPRRPGRALRSTGFVLGIILIELTRGYIAAGLGPDYGRTMRGRGNCQAIVLLRRSRRGFEAGGGGRRELPPTSRLSIRRPSIHSTVRVEH